MHDVILHSTDLANDVINLHFNEYGSRENESRYTTSLHTSLHEFSTVYYMYM
jgi:hypothetical protein